MDAESEGSPVKRRRLSFSEDMEVVVGQDDTKSSFMVYTDSITSRSSFFKAACSERWAKLEKNSIELSEDDPDIFNIYLHCLDKDAVCTGDLEEHWDGEEDVIDGNHVDKTFLRLFKLFILADKLGDMVTANKTITEFIQYSSLVNHVPDGKAIEVLFLNSAPGSSLRRLVVDLYVYETDISAIEGLMEDTRVPKDFIYLVAIELTRLKESHRDDTVGGVFPRKFTGKDPCRYHTHDEHLAPPCVKERKEI